VPLYLLPLAALILFLSPAPQRPNQSKIQNPKSKIASPHSTQLTQLTHLTLRLLLLLVALVGTFVITDLLIERGAYLAHFRQSWTSHFGPQKSFEYGSPADHPFPWSLLLKNWDTTVPAAIGAFLVLRSLCSRLQRQGKKPGARSQEPVGGSKFEVQSSTFKVPAHLLHSPFSILPLAWLVLSLLVFTIHRPWWSYYYIHLAIPLSWCAAIGIAAAFKFVAAEVRRRKSKIQNRKSKIPRPFSILDSRFSIPALTLLTLYALATTAWASARIYLQISSIRSSPQTYNSLVLTEMARYKPFTEWLYTDEPVYSFHAGIPMPPDLAVIMLKRYWSGEMTTARLASELRDIKPGLILLRNDSRELPFQDLLISDYHLVYQDGDHRLYAHRTISKKPRR
jgi:hypothetical protein